MKSVVALILAILLFEPDARFTVSAQQGSFAALGGAPSIEDEVLQDMLAQPIGAGTFLDQRFPESFLRRVADRIIRDSYERHFRIVVADANSQPTSMPSSQPTRPTNIRWLPPELDADVQEGALSGDAAPLPNGVHIVRSIGLDPTSLPNPAVGETRPPLRGWRPTPEWPSLPPDKSTHPQAAEAARLVSERLADAGLLVTAAEAIHALGALERYAACGSAELTELRSIGIPTDFLRYFSDTSTRRPVPAAADDAEVIRWIAHRLAESPGWFELEADLRGREFVFQPSPLLQQKLAASSADLAIEDAAAARFRVADESGAISIGGLRLQLTRGTDWQAPGDGGAIDLARQLAALIPSTPLQLVIEQRHVADLVAGLREWLPAAGRQVRISPVEFPLSQWTQDTCKFGRLIDSSGTPRAAAAIVPRYASRGEAGTLHVPGDTAAFPGVLHATGVAAIIQSPLLFQGGDLLIATHPKTGRRVMLMGEAQAYRNVALGLSLNQVLHAFCLEFGVDECMVVPAVSFHLDFEVSVRAVGERLVALVNDDKAARNLILRAGVRTLSERKVLSPAQAGGALAHLDAGRWREFMNTAVSPLMARSVAFGQFPESLAQAFASGPGDSGVGNFQRFLLAVDLYLADHLPETEVPADRPHGYIRAIRRRGADRRELHTKLAEAGFHVAPVPSLSDSLRGINYLNGLHTPTHYYMPAWGGYFRDLDEAASAAIAKALGPGVTIAPVYCAETQRRGGALRCAVAVIPARTP